MPAERGGAVAGVVLAAGSSTRMGRNKLFFELDGETLLRRAVRRAVDAGLDPVLVVVGHEAARARTELADLACTPVDNPDHALGVNRSLRTGISHVPERARAAVVMLADMPFVTTRMVAVLVARYRESTAPLVISAYGDVNAPPMLYDRTLFSELRQMSGEGCGRQVVRRHRHEAVAVAWPSAALQDVDVPEDYERIRAELEVGDAGDVAGADGAGSGIHPAGNGPGAEDTGSDTGDAGDVAGADGAGSGIHPAGNGPGAEDTGSDTGAAANGPGADGAGSDTGAAGDGPGADDAGGATG